MTCRPRGQVPWRELTLPILIPNLLYGSGQGAAIPAIPLTALAVTGSPAQASVVAAMLTVGQLLLVLPAGWLIGTFGERPAMLVSTLATGLGGLGAYLASSLAGLVVSVFVIGCGVAVFTMARHAWVTVGVPIAVRGRALSTVAGSTRLGMFAGPFLAAAAIHLTGGARGAFFTIVATSAVLALFVALAPLHNDDQPNLEPGSHPKVVRTMWERRNVLLRLGLTISVITTLRSTKRILIPLVGAAIGMEDATVALVVGVTYGLDFSMFYLGGLVVDRWGPLAVAVPTLIAFGLAHVGLAVTIHLQGALWWYLSSSLVMAVANGVSGGVVDTVGSNLADPRSPAPFLSSWRLTTNLGPCIAPFIVAALAGALSLSLASGTFTALAALAAALLPRYVRLHLSHRQQ